MGRQSTKFSGLTYSIMGAVASAKELVQWAGCFSEPLIDNEDFCIVGVRLLAWLTNCRNEYAKEWQRSELRDRLSEALVSNGMPDVLTGNRRFLSWHEAAIAVASGFLFDCIAATDPKQQQLSRIAKGQQCDVDITDAVGNLAAVARRIQGCETDWEEIYVGIQREAILLNAVSSRVSTRSPTKRGRPVTADRVASDQKIFEMWKSGAYPTYKDLADELHLPKAKIVELACDRVRKRQSPESG